MLSVFAAIHDRQEPAWDTWDRVGQEGCADWTLLAAPEGTRAEDELVERRREEEKMRARCLDDVIAVDRHIIRPVDAIGVVRIRLLQERLADRRRECRKGGEVALESGLVDGVLAEFRGLPHRSGAEEHAMTRLAVARIGDPQGRAGAGFAGLGVEDEGRLMP